MSALRPVSSAFLNNLKSLFPETSGRVLVESGGRLVESQVLTNPWFIVAAVAFSTSNRPEAVPRVFEHVMQGLKESGSDTSAERLVAQKFREALFKSGLISGYPKAINSLKALHEVMPESLQDKTIHRDTRASLAECEATGQKLWRHVYGDKADSIQDLLDTIYPDMGWFSKTIGYGLTYGHIDILSPLETSYTLVASLIAGDTPQQIAWHLDGALRGGATLQEVQAVREISIQVAKHSGISWQHDVPEVAAITSDLEPPTKIAISD
ncbi:hypothetical protein B0H34DRAFT_794599 [Crassisporium funariophilum]|nr:hypothetical protein B0H34DRAFT_794599 [Crassisporium funariophilum]